MAKKKQIRTKLTWRETFHLYKDTILEFSKEKTFIHSASLSYYTVLSLVPIIYLSIVSFGKIIGQETMVKIISNFLKDNIGIQDIKGILEFLNQMNFEKSNFWMQTVVIITLLISCSALFNSLKFSMNEFYDIEKKFTSNKKMIISSLGARLKSIGILAFFGFSIVVTYFFQTILISFGTKLFSDLSFMQWVVYTFTQHLLAIISNIFIFWLIFKFLHDAFVPWKIALAGSVFTSILLYIGQLLIKYYLTNYFFARDTGLAGTILVILVWMYYTSQIIFLGAKFTSVYAQKLGKPLQVD
ncbi:MAG: YihY/virulence factor BrkB family protein [Flavobacteriia bacterium]|jgi:membrane protein